MKITHKGIILVTVPLACQLAYSHHFKVTKEGVEISLATREFQLLDFFMRNPNKAFKQEEILDRVWSSESNSSPDTVRVHINRLRNKIDCPGQQSLIRTIPRLGYIFEPQ